MSDMFSLGSDTVTAMNTDKVTENGNDIVQFGNDLLDVLSDFDTVITTLTTNGMQGYMSTQAQANYDKVKDSLTDYANALVKTGNTVLDAVSEMSKASTTAGDALSVVQ